MRDGISRSETKAARKVSAAEVGGSGYKYTEFGMTRRSGVLRFLRRAIGLVCVPFAWAVGNGARWRAWLTRWSRAHSAAHTSPGPPVPPAPPRT
jgi:hypothetical protein